ncbi:hypothetical protein [Candidatus Gromoviella agglomerans]|uniref:hypothetical protein n=1 Tax=Candidatus Gromoviella agglomerans TaxID=2806609 RepID=UPI001E2DAE0A|nr:hypothetical protein [Candidatus Gromoviella agglomerans]UFX98213.1 hypothetical protein Gromo_00093 [Candidatus Gromoviella agglomerans]
MNKVFNDFFIICIIAGIVSVETCGSNNKMYLDQDIKDSTSPKSRIYQYMNHAKLNQKSNSESYQTPQRIHIPPKQTRDIPKTSKKFVRIHEVDDDIYVRKGEYPRYASPKINSMYVDQSDYVMDEDYVKRGLNFKSEKDRHGKEFQSRVFDFREIEEIREKMKILENKRSQLDKVFEKEIHSINQHKQNEIDEYNARLKALRTLASKKSRYIEDRIREIEMYFERFDLDLEVIMNADKKHRVYNEKICKLVDELVQLKDLLKMCTSFGEEDNLLCDSMTADQFGKDSKKKYSRQSQYLDESHQSVHEQKSERDDQNLSKHYIAKKKKEFDIQNQFLAMQEKMDNQIKIIQETQKKIEETQTSSQNLFKMVADNNRIVKELDEKFQQLSPQSSQLYLQPQQPQFQQQSPLPKNQGYNQQQPQQLQPQQPQFQQQQQLGKNQGYNQHQPQQPQFQQQQQLGKNQGYNQHQPQQPQFQQQQQLGKNQGYNQHQPQQPQFQQQQQLGKNQGYNQQQPQQPQFQQQPLGKNQGYNQHQPQQPQFQQQQLGKNQGYNQHQPQQPQFQQQQQLGKNQGYNQQQPQQPQFQQQPLGKNQGYNQHQPQQPQFQQQQLGKNQGYNQHQPQQPQFQQQQQLGKNQGYNQQQPQQPLQQQQLGKNQGYNQHQPQQQPYIDQQNRTSRFLTGGTNNFMQNDTQKNALNMRNNTTAEHSDGKVEPFINKSLNQSYTYDDTTFNKGNYINSTPGEHIQHFSNKRYYNNQTPQSDLLALMGQDSRNYENPHYIDFTNVQNQNVPYTLYEQEEGLGDGDISIEQTIQHSLFHEGN